MLQVRDDSDRKFIPINASQLQKKSSTDCTSSVERNSVNYICNERVYHEEYMDEQFRYLYEIRPILVCALEKLKKKFKKVSSCNINHSRTFSFFQAIMFSDYLTTGIFRLLIGFLF